MPRTIAPVVPAGRMSDAEQPELRSGDGLILRRWRHADAPALVAAYADASIQRWHRRRLDSEAEAEARELIDSWTREWAEEVRACWVITDETGSCLGRLCAGGWHDMHLHARISGPPAGQRPEQAGAASLY